VNKVMHLQLILSQSKIDFESPEAVKLSNISVMRLSLPYSSLLRVFKWPVTTTKKKKTLDHLSILHHPVLQLFCSSFP
jgi:hypothetical protein